MEITIDTSLGTILDDPKAKAVLDQYLPGVADNPLTALAKGMSLKTFLSMPQAAQLGLTQEKVEKVLEEINKKL